MSFFSQKQDGLYETVSGPELEQVLREMGFAPELTKDGGGDPLIRLRVQGYKSIVAFYGCKEGRASSIQFGAAFTGFTESLSKINEWNKKKRFGKAYLDSDGDPRCEFDVDLSGGVSRAYLEEVTKRWQSVLPQFVAFLQD